MPFILWRIQWHGGSPALDNGNAFVKNWASLVVKATEQSGTTLILASKSLARIKEDLE